MGLVGLVIDIFQLSQNVILLHPPPFEDVEPQSLVAVDNPPGRLVYLLDEPEAHLHLTAQRDVAEAAQALAVVGQGALVATHSLAFVDDPGGHTELATVVHTDTEITVEMGLGMSALRERAENLGIRPSALAQACRAMLVVEGRNDAELLRRYGDIDLDRHFVVIGVLQGHYGVPSIAELEFVHALRIPVVVLLDHVRRSILRDALARRGPLRGLHGEEQSLVALHRSLAARRLSAYSLPFSKPDIVCALPEDEVRWALKQLDGKHFDGWAPLLAEADDRFKQTRATFKETFEESVGRSVEQVIGAIIKGDRRGRSAVLHAALATLIDALSDPSAQIGLEVL